MKDTVCWDVALRAGMWHCVALCAGMWHCVLGCGTCSLAKIYIFITDTPAYSKTFLKMESMSHPKTHKKVFLKKNESLRSAHISGARASIFCTVTPNLMRFIACILLHPQQHGTHTQVSYNFNINNIAILNLPIYILDF